MVQATNVITKILLKKVLQIRLLFEYFILEVKINHLFILSKLFTIKSLEMLD